MAYGLSTRASYSNAATQPVVANDPGTIARSWQTLNEACRLAIVERALRPATDHHDGFPVAL